MSLAYTNSALHTHTHTHPQRCQAPRTHTHAHTNTHEHTYRAFRQVLLASGTDLGVDKVFVGEAVGVAHALSTEGCCGDIMHQDTSEWRSNRESLHCDKQANGVGSHSCVPCSNVALTHTTHVIPTSSTRSQMCCALVVAVQAGLWTLT